MTNAVPKRVIVYTTPDGQEPFNEWMNGLRDVMGRKRILARVSRIQQGNYGDCKPVGEGVSELRIRLAIVHERADLSDAPRFLLTDALHWDSSRIFATWSFRWPVETFHQFAKQLTGFEDAQLRNEEAVKRHFCLSCVAQSVLQSASCSGQNSERFNFANDHEQTIGQRLFSLSREAIQQLVEFTQSLMNQGKSVEQIMEVLMPT